MRNIQAVDWKFILTKLIKANEPLLSVIDAIHKQGGYVFLVGGAVRDLLLGLPIKDLDIEVHGLSLDALSQVLSEFGVVNKVGKSFGVLRLSNLDIDWSIPRTDASGRKPEVKLDPHMPLEKAFERRDLTINSMGIDLHNFKLIDPFGGLKDLEQGVLRPTNEEFFKEDPLRLFRVMQFISRFEMQPTESLNNICKTMPFNMVSRERIEEEFKKMLLKSEKPSLGIRWLDSIGRLEEVLPELYKTKGVPQNPEWHPEGDVFEHSLQALDQAAQLSYENERERYVILLAALVHDLGKITTTKYIDGKWRSIGHAQAGQPLIHDMLRRVTGNKEIIKTVLRLCKYHIEPYMFASSDTKAGAYKRLAAKLAPLTNISQLIKLCIADKRGRQGAQKQDLTQLLGLTDTFLNRAKEYGVLYHPEKPILTGSDIKDIVTPGPCMGELLYRAYQWQMDNGVSDKLRLKKYVEQLLQTADIDACKK